MARPASLPANFWEADPIHPVTDPALLAKLNGKDGRPIADPVLLAKLNGDPSIAADVGKSAAGGAAQGAIGTVGAAGDLRHAASAAADYLGEKLGVSPETVKSVKDGAYNAAQWTLPTTVLSNAPGSGDISHFVGGDRGNRNAVGEVLDYKPQTAAGKFTHTAAEYAPALLGGGEGLISKLATRVLAPAAASEAAGKVAEGTAAEPWARAGGALMSPAILSIGRRAITPLPATAERSALVDTLRNEGIHVTAGQATGSKPLQWAESALSDLPGAGGGAAHTMATQGEQFTGAALRRAGEQAERATPDVIDNAFNRIGNQFETIGARNHLRPDAQLAQDLRASRDEYQNLVGPHARAPVIDNTIADIADQMQRNGGVLTGQQYNAMTSRLARQARDMQNDPQLRNALHGIRDSLDDAFERSLTRAGNTADAAALREARNQYRNLMVVEKAATGAGSAAAEGLISPSQLRNAVVQQDRRGYARGRGDFSDLARAAEAIMKPLPQSGTAPRQYINHLISLLSAGIGGATAGLPGVAAGIAAPAAAGRLLMAPWVQGYLGNQVLGQAGPESGVSRLARTLTAARGASLPPPGQDQLPP
ncbi:hypothetical protein [Bradyrhizobium canariense]|uniref:Uncharacterized protein n=1 Tax=Bradyrhizobium canariense TaxID=255045 RepID=A0A1X3FR05_9BRAD|nr:hypothetical protein [Bradyrhizobium canariense]OSI68882.1 hypothetical protein BSZ22_19850 [Bradyrhizobium canariense]OSI79406.1 hypothetical protein BSZ23_15090 [Bradyrhizobium canariense]OSI89596.1 hypothetical protein BSZ25_20310 [Bradyrhizobium canariense]OSI91026.1 hypothetical protein BSZ24_18895 [Bradyrhizobium canariense]OSJ03962.1 hypothetical protein BSZ16_14745 [Bradyrhizobium canariense]